MQKVNTRIVWDDITDLEATLTQLKSQTERLAATAKAAGRPGQGNTQAADEFESAYNSQNRNMLNLAKFRIYAIDTPRAAVVANNTGKTLISDITTAAAHLVKACDKALEETQSAQVKRRAHSIVPSIETIEAVEAAEKAFTSLVAALVVEHRANKKASHNKGTHK